MMEWIVRNRAAGMDTKARRYWRGEGENFMTPEVVEYLDLDNGLMVELSEGTGFDNQPIFGVSVADAEGNRLFGESQMFYSIEDARSHITELEGMEASD